MVLKARRAGWLAPLVVAGCLDALEYPCESVTQCTVDGKDGTCHASGWCVYPDDECPSGQRFGPAAGDGLADDCLGASSQEGSAGESGSEVSSASSGPIEPTTGDCGECSEPPGECHAAMGACNGASGVCEYEPLEAGTPCELEDPCAIEAECDGEGECTAVVTMECETPPSTCHMSPGACDPIEGECVYELRAAGAACEDGNGCTQGDTCDAAGLCAAGAMCESDDACQVGACMGDACVFSAAADGTSCGATTAERCCAGACADISTDAANCGGCGAVCQSDETCESVAVTTQCSPHPEDTTGRCTCNGENADCPHGQICVTVAPVVDRCAPENVGDCPGGAFHDVPSCPNYCEYVD
jgi:hypothetical protein